MTCQCTLCVVVSCWQTQCES